MNLDEYRQRFSDGSTPGWDAIQGSLEGRIADLVTGRMRVSERLAYVAASLRDAFL